MRKIGVIALVLAVSAVAASAAIKTSAAEGALKMTLQIDPVTGIATMYDNTGANLITEGYEIRSAGLHLTPASTTTTNDWLALADILVMNTYVGGTAAAKQAKLDAMQTALARNPVHVYDAESESWYWETAPGGYPVDGWTRQSNTTALLAEASTTKEDPANGIQYGGEAVFKPGLAAGWAVGKPVAMWTTNNAALASDLSFYYIIPSDRGNKYLGVINVLPEPATMAILAIGGIVMTIRRRR